MFPRCKRRWASLVESSLSQHLARLREDELVTTRRELQAIFYSLANANQVCRAIPSFTQLFCAEECDAKTEAEEGGTKGRREGELFARPHKIERTRHMTIDRIVMAFAGAMILASTKIRPAQARIRKTKFIRIDSPVERP